MAGPRHLGIRTVWAIALAFGVSACASTRSAPTPFPMPPPKVARGPEPRVTRPRPDAPPVLEPAPDGRASAATVDRLLRTALDLRGTPYRNGGATPSGFDCSGFTQWVFAQAGERLPRDTADQFKQGRAVSRGQLQPGDLVFFTTTAKGASHVGIALGGDTFVHAPSSRGVVRIESLSLPYWSTRFIGVRRIIAD